MCVANPAMSTDAALSLTLFMNQHSIKTASRQKIILSGMGGINLICRVAVLPWFFAL